LEISQNLSFTYVILPSWSVIATTADSSRAAFKSAILLSEPRNASSASLRAVMSRVA